MFAGRCGAQGGGYVDDETRKCLNMGTCCVCKVSVVGACLICSGCFAAWPKGLNFSEYCKRPYKPEPVVYPRGMSNCEEPP